MSGYFDVREKVVEGENWRDTIEVDWAGQTVELTVRQLRDPEFFQVANNLDFDMFLDNDSIAEGDEERYQELVDKRSSDEELTDEEQEEFDELVEELEEDAGELFQKLDRESYEALIYAAKCGVEPDKDDIDYIVQHPPSKLKEMFGKDVVAPVLEDRQRVSREAAREIFERDIEQRLRNASDFVAFKVGMEVLAKTVPENEGK